MPIGAAALLACAMAALLAGRLFRQVVIRDQLDQQLRAGGVGLILQGG